MLDEGILARAIERLEVEIAIDAIWIFGSEASGRAREGSDIDLAILTGEAIPAELSLRLHTLIEETVGRNVDLVDLRQASPTLGMQVVNHGRLVLDRNPASRARFVASLPSRRYDLVRVRREAERHLLERMSRGRA